MFGRLFVKEWKEKIHIFMFGLALLVLCLVVELGLPKDQNACEIVAGGLLILFFPFMGVLLGAGGFESESRNDAWAYLFSRPISKVTIWVAKFMALLSILAGLWLGFLGMLWAVPGFHALVEGLRLPIAFRAAISLLPWSLLFSLFFLTIAFSLSVLSGKWSTVLFTSSFAGLVLVLLASGEAAVVLGFIRQEWLDEDTWLHALRWGTIFMAIAFAGASALTLKRADFSQPRKKTARFIGYAAPFLVTAVVFSAAWTALLPRMGERYLRLTGKSGSEAFFKTENGLFKYSPDRDQVTRLAKGVVLDFGISSVRNGKIVYVAYEMWRNNKNNPEVLWAISADGSGKTRLAGGGFKTGDPRVSIDPWHLALSFDGQRVAILDERARSVAGRTPTPLWSMKSDGTELKPHVLDPAIFDNANDYFVELAGWTGSQNGVLISLLSRRAGFPSKLWVSNIDNGTSRILLEYIAVGWYVLPSPGGRMLAIPYKILEKDNARLAIALVDLDSLQIKTVGVDGNRSIFRPNWSPSGDKLAFFARKGTSRGSGAYILETVSVPDLKVLASREMTTEERTGQLYDLDWLSDGSRLAVSDPTDRCLKILGPDLGEEKRIPFPASIRSPFNIMVSGDKVMINDDARHALWRLDLKTGAWKRIY